MNKAKKAAFGALAVLLMTILVAFPVSAAPATSSTSFNLALATNQIQFKIPAGTTFNGTITTTGMIRFWVTAPNEAPTVNLGIIDSKGSFNFVAQQNGTYTFNFENDMPNTVQVTFTYTTDPALPGNNSDIGLLPYIVVIIVAVVGSLLIILVVRRKNKKVASIQSKMAQTR